MNNNVPQQPVKRLYRSKRDRLIAGVCGGIADYFRIDPVIIRVLFIFLAFGFGAAILAYILLWVIVPEEPSHLK